MKFEIDHTKLAETLKVAGLSGDNNPITPYEGSWAETERKRNDTVYAQEKFYAPTRGQMHRCRFCWMEVDKTDNGFKPAGKSYPHAAGCPHIGKF